MFCVSSGPATPHVPTYFLFLLGDCLLCCVIFSGRWCCCCCWWCSCCCWAITGKAIHLPTHEISLSLPRHVNYSATRRQHNNNNNSHGDLWWHDWGMAPSVYCVMRRGGGGIGSSRSSSQKQLWNEIFGNILQIKSRQINFWFKGNLIKRI